MSQFPEDATFLVNLKKLDLSFNDFTSVPEVIQTMGAISHVSMAFNNITTLPTWLFFMPQLNVLNFAGNRIEKIPTLIQIDKWLTENRAWLTKLRILKPASEATSIIYEKPGPRDGSSPGGGGSMQSTTNRIGSYSLETIPLTSIPPLEVLMFNSNRLAAVPSLFLFYSSTLTTLYMAHNRISIIPNSIFQSFLKLARIDFSYNRIKTLPQSFFAFSRRSLAADLSHNKLRDLPQFRLVTGLQPSSPSPTPTFLIAPQGASVVSDAQLPVVEKKTPEERYPLSSPVLKYDVYDNLGITAPSNVRW
jgi:Leucine-rich repeat (LRR) protein